MIAVRDYDAPATPTEHAIRRLWRLARLRLQPDLDDPVQAGERLQPATRALLDEVAQPPACAPLIDELDSAVRSWQREAGDDIWRRVVVLPPCDSGDLMGTWAAQQGHTVLAAPARSILCSLADPVDLDALPGGKGLLVIPRLEDWMLRRRDGLHALRTLLASLARLERPCLVGCNSWAWAFAEKAVGAALVLPRPMTFAPFDAHRLCEWFTSLAANDGEPQAEGGQAVVFRLASSGADVLRKDGDGDNGHDNYLKRLAALSLGIPWVAWHLWRQGLRAASDSDDLPEKVQKATEGDERTLWVSALPEYTLPAHHEQVALLVLQALLMHAGLTEPELRSVLPVLEEPGIVAALQSAGFIERSARDGMPRVRPAAYPAARTALRADGFPVGEL